jgi:hypothetical protein
VTLSLRRRLLFIDARGAGQIDREGLWVAASVSH